MLRYGLFMFLALGACDDDKGGETGNLGETGDTGDDTGPDDTGNTDTVDTSVPCETVLLDASPNDEETDWYYRDSLSLTFSDDAAGATIQLYDAAGTELPTSISWSDGNFQAEVAPDEPLAGSTTYTLHIEVCEYTGDLTFTTSVYGSPLAEAAAGLVDHTYVLDLSQADINQPEGLGYLLASYLTEPLLIGVVEADEASIELVGAQGWKKADGTYRQAGDQVWLFPAADFTSNPFFQASTELITIDYGDSSIPIESFYLEGTFAPDGSAIGGGLASGWGDTREMGPLLELGDDPDAVCGLLTAMGMDVCEPCSDGEPYCLFLEAEFDEAPLAADLIIDLDPTTSG